MTRMFTGWHMLAVMLGMFGVIIGVNVAMAHAAISTFGGVVVENSYVASQRYNSWLAEARDQSKLGWKVDVTVDAERRVHIAAIAQGAPLEGAAIRAAATHPLGLETEKDLTFRALGSGRYISDRAIAPGRWLLRLDVSRGEQNAMFDDEVPA